MGSRRRGQVEQEIDLPIFNQGGWISTKTAIPRQGHYVEYYWRDFRDEERIYVCKFSIDENDEYTTFSDVNGTAGWESAFEEFWRPIDWQKQQSALLSSQQREIELLREKNDRMSAELKHLREYFGEDEYQKELDRMSQDYNSGNGYL